MRGCWARWAKNGVKIAGFDSHPEFMGREALIGREHAAVHLIDHE
jgi:hypothetical protein